MAYDPSAIARLLMMFPPDSQPQPPQTMGVPFGILGGAPQPPQNPMQLAGDVVPLPIQPGAAAPTRYSQPADVVPLNKDRGSQIPEWLRILATPAPLTFKLRE